MPNQRPTLRIVLSVIAAMAAVASFSWSGYAQNADWAAYNGGLDGDHYSRLNQINTRNVSQLGIAWTYDTGEKGGIQNNPLMVGRTLYAYTPSQKIVALDAASGQLKWKFDAGVKSSQPARGMTWWTDGREARLFAGVMNFLYCLDPVTGQPIRSFGEDGRIDLRKNLRGDFEKQSVVLTSPGLLYKDLLIVGGRNPETHPSPPGDIRAFDVRTGQLRWSFHTIPHPGEPGYETWPKDAWLTAGAANNWAGMTLDAERGIVFIPTGSPVMDFYGGDRVGDDLYANCELAIDAATGKLLWHFQGVHHDIWDRDFDAPPALFTFRRNGKSIPAVAQTSKQGYLYEFNRITGEPLFPITERPYPASTIPGEVTSKTQPLPDWPQPFSRQRLTADDLTTRTPQVHEWAVNQFKNIRSDGQFLPLALKQDTIVLPGFDGGAEWGGPAVDPVHNILYVNANEMAWIGSLVAVPRGGRPGERTYRDQCAVCHGLDLSGSPPSFPSLVAIDKRLSDDAIAQTVRGGKGRMPSFPNIDQQRLTDLLAYLHSGGAQPGKELASVPSDTPSGASQAADPAGAAVYAARCAACHGEHMEGNPPAFPMLMGVSSRLTPDQIADVIHHGRGRMPAVTGLEGSDLDALLRYIGVRKDKSDTEDQPNEYTFNGYRKFLDPDGYPAFNPPWGTLSAIDLNTGKYLWKINLGEYPALAAQGLKNTGTENYGGPVVTAGGVLFIGATVADHRFRAFDSATGKLLWETEMPFAGVATPATYMVDGVQYVVIAASGGRDPHSPTGGEYIAFALPRRK